MSTEKNSSDDLRSEFDRLDEVRLTIKNKFKRNSLLFFLFLQDKDGFITLQEFRAYHSKTNKDDSAIAKAFAAIDSDKDGLVTFEGIKTNYFIKKNLISFLEFQRAYKD